jgi:hypothetical protein
VRISKRTAWLSAILGATAPHNNALKLTVGRRHDIRARPQLNAVLCGRDA